MADTINVRDLDDDDVDLLETMAEKLRERAGRRKAAEKAQKPQGEEEEFLFGSRHSKVIGTLTREEIYEDR